MANELKHKAVGTVLTQTEFEATDSHAFNSQATGDIMYASSATQLSRLAKGTQGYPLVMGASVPQWGGALTLNGTLSLGGQTFDAGAGGLTLITTGGNRGLDITTTNGGGDGILIDLYHNSSSPADYDDIGKLNFFAKSSTGTKTTFASLLVESSVVLAGSEETLVTLALRNAGAWNTDALFITGAGILKPDHSILFAQSFDSAAVADQVSLGAYEIGVGHRALAISSEEVVVTEAIGASDRTLPVRINGVTYKIMLVAV